MSTIRKYVISPIPFPTVYEYHIIGRPIDPEEYTMTVCFFKGIDDVVEHYIRTSNMRNGYRNYLIWELYWESNYSAKDLAILSGLTESTIRRILNKIDKLVWDNRDEWFIDKSGLS